MTRGGQSPALRPGCASCANGEGNPGTLRLRPGSRQCRCGACDRFFWSVAAFDRHQRLAADGAVVCRDPAALGMVQRDDGFWITMRRTPSSIGGVRTTTGAGSPARWSVRS